MNNLVRISLIRRFCGIGESRRLYPLAHLAFEVAVVTAWFALFFPAYGQTQIPSNLTLSIARPASNNVVLSWPTTPGLSYDLLATPILDQPFTLINPQPLQARTTVSTFLDTNGADAQFYRVAQRASPPGNAQPITASTVAEAEKSLGLTFTTGQRAGIASILSSTSDTYLFGRAGYEQMRRYRLQNEDPPALVFDPLPPGFVLPKEQQPILWSTPGPVSIPANLAELAFYSVRDLGELIRTRQITSTELTKLSLDRLKRYDKTLFCVITLTEQLALEQAARADAEIADGSYRGPLHGIPYGLKDLFSTRTYPTTWGAGPYRDQVIDRDAIVVQKLEAAGAVLVAKLSLGELASFDWWFGGQTRNPWNPSQGSAGSSAGPAAATAAGLVPFAIGGETIGSILEPCTVCRVTGLRPTFGRVSRTGAMALSWSLDKVGPIARTVEDCAFVLEAIRGPGGTDASVIEASFNYSAVRDLRGLRIGYRRGRIPSSAITRLKGIARATNVFEVQLPNYPYQAMSIILNVEGGAAFDEFMRSGGIDLLGQGGNPFHAATSFRAARFIPAIEYLQADRLRRKLIVDMAVLMESVDLYITNLDDEPSLFLTNYTGHPSVVIPHGNGTGLIFVGRLFDEATILELAKAYQDQTTFHTGRPPGFLK